MCLKVKSNTWSHRNVNTCDTNDTNLENQVETTQAIPTRSNFESLLDRSTKLETSLKSNDSHIYQEIEDLYIDDSIPSNLDSKC